MKNIKLIVSSAFIILLTACSGGGSASGGPQTNNDGTYIGVAMLTLSAQGQSETQPIDLQAVIQNNTLTSVSLDGQVITGSTPLAGNNVSFFLEDTVPAMLDDDITCTGSIEFAGMVAGDIFSGPINGQLDCSSNGVSVQFAATGSFEATRG